MSALAAKKLAKEVAELRASPDNKRCFNCESLGTTYYVPQYSIFVCTQCSGIHMQFAHRVKSVTLAEYKADEVEHMREGGNQVAAYRFLARYTPDKDLRKPVDRNPQRIRTWIQTVFMDKRYFSADAPIPRRSADGAAAAAGSGSAGGLVLSPSASLRRAGSMREGSVATSPLPSPASAAASAAYGHSQPGSPPVRDMRELLGDRATTLQVGPKVSTDSLGSSGGGRPAVQQQQQQATPQTPVAPKPAPSSPGSSKGGKAAPKELAADLFADFSYAQPQQAGMPFQQQMPYAMPGMQQPGYGLPQQQQQQQQPAHQAWALQQQQALMWQHQQYQQQQQQQQMQQQLQQQQAAYSAMYGGMRPPQGYGMPGMPGGQGMPYAAAPGMNGAGGFGTAGYMGMQQQPQQQQQGSGPPSAGSAAAAGVWSATSAAAGVTEENAFADLVDLTDLKKALPTAAGSSGGGGAPGFPQQQQQQQPYGMGMPAAGMPQGMPGSVLIIDSSSRDEHALQASPLQHVGRRLKQQQMLGEPEPIMKWLVAKHNELRARHGVPPMVWDWGLAWNAYNYVLNCPNGHSGQPGIGENLAWGHNDFNHAMRDWYDEIQFYNFARPSFAENTGHFSALVWKDSQRIGCAANLRCRFKTWICQFTPPGNYVLAGGGVDVALWSSQVLPPSQQFVTGTRPDGSPSYASYDPTGESTRGLPAPQYGELKNFGFVPKPGSSVTMYDWQRFVPTSVITQHIPAAVLAQYLDNDTLAMLAPDAAGAVKTQRTLVGWQRAIPASIMLQYVPDMQEALDRHNMYRRRHQAPPLAWDAAMAAQAAQFAAGCPMGRSGRVGLGESLAFGYPDAASVVNAWYAQVAAYNFAAPGFYPAAAQFSQLVWADSERVGCAVAAGCSMPTFVCNYYPAGNVVGRDWSSSVRAAAAALPKTVVGGAQPTAAVPKPSRPTPGAARAFYARLGQPVANDGSPISRSSAPQQHAAAAVLSPELQAAVDRQNSLRAKHGAPALQWDDAIASTAQSWAAGCPNGHSGTRGVGENMAWGYASLADAVQAWYDEVKLYDFSNPGWSPSTGHFTQIVWLSTSRLGCAINSACSWPTYVCQYGPPGNILGTDWSKQVQREGTPLPPGPTTTAANTAKASPSPSPKPSRKPAAPTWPGFMPVVKPKPSPSPSPSPAAAAGPKEPELAAGWAALNGFRKKHQAPALAWDEKLAASAKAWAATCQFAVSRTPGVGEGLGFGYSSLPEAVQDWYAQVSAYNFAQPGWSSDSGLFSQIVWKDTKAVGCAFNRACPWAMYVCHYSPPGSMVGPGIDWSKQVLPASTASPAAAAVPKPAAAAAAAVLKPGSGIASLMDSFQLFGSRGTSFEQPAGPAEPELAEALAATNAYRARHQASPLAWDEELAAQAAAYLAECPTTVSTARGVGENMAWGFPSFAAAVDAWAGEASSYNFSTPGFSLLAGHFSQLVWRSSSKLGCAVNTDCEWGAYRCLYYPPGNDIAADWSEQVMPDIDAAASDDAAYSSWTPALPTSADPAAEYAAVLTATNAYRAKHQAPPLAWDAALAVRAQAFAAGCPNGHSGDRGVGENLAWGYQSWQAAVDGWYNEVDQYSFASPGFSGATGHFTQLVWRGTTKMGCGLNSRCGMATYVCQYSPPGNVMGIDWSTQVLPARQ
ncbi:hypothetical protein OEZ86_001310 [Tetradesmus obliquus]|nr:hypothetical protein OEZ86_001310 [Tetradesmus obliquus]